MHLLFFLPSLHPSCNLIAVSNFPSALNSSFCCCLSIVFFFFFFLDLQRRELLYPFTSLSLFDPRKKRGFFLFFYSTGGFDPSPFRSLRIIVPRISPRSFVSISAFLVLCLRIFSPLFLRVYFVYLFFSLFLHSHFCSRLFLSSCRTSAMLIDTRENFRETKVVILLET